MNQKQNYKRIEKRRAAFIAVFFCKKSLWRKAILETIALFFLNSIKHKVFALS
ncbi:hypothetical protein CU019_0063 [Enterococcus faecium]|nr:hypothetical protein HMPREF1347_00800 [Enterococcus faecium 504]MBK4762093.1 hypothetical protein [Enterococcus faecium]MBK4789134.1 hypothetical protein [Enterococcus faecium]MBK4797266.1 hypothetical protein [Enterococcus faecium]MBK4818673.1 hypothetical protein [Enterococcus faecium]